MHKELRHIILLAAGLVLAGIIVVWIGLTAIRFQQPGDWFLVVVFLLGAGLCLSGSILGLTPWLRRFIHNKAQLSSRSRRRHLKPAEHSLAGSIPEAEPARIIQFEWGLSLWQVTWSVILAILVPILVWLGVAFIRLSPTGVSFASLWMESLVSAWLPALIKSWPITGAWLQAICLLAVGITFLRSNRGKRTGDPKLVRAPQHPGHPGGNTNLIHRQGLTPWTVCFSLLAGIGLWLVCIFMQRITLTITPPGWLVWFSTVAIDQTHGYGRVAGIPVNGLVLAMAIIFVPLVEEVFFRGFVYHAWSNRFNETGGLVVSSALWAIYSLNPLVMPSLFLVGLGLGLITRQMVYSSGTIQDTRQIILGMVPVWLARLVFTFIIFLV